MIKVKVTTFKKSGKYYDEWTIEVEPKTDTWYEIIEAVRAEKIRTTAPQREMDWLIGMDDSRNDMYPVLLKN